MHAARAGIYARLPPESCVHPTARLVLVEVLKRHIILADLLAANFRWTRIGVFHTGHHTRLEALAFLYQLFHALGIYIFSVR